MELEILATNGFIVYANELGKFIVEKKQSNINSIKIEPLEFKTFKLAVNYIEETLNKPKEWQAIIRYNKGLGIEYKNIQPILAESREEVKEIAKQQVEKLLGNSIIEIKAVPILK